MKYLIVLVAIILGATIQNGCSKTNEECNKIGKKVNFHVHGVYRAFFTYTDCISGTEITRQLISGERLSGWAMPKTMIRVEILVAHPFTQATKNGAYVNVGEIILDDKKQVDIEKNKMNIDCGGTTYINRRCDCNGQPCPTTD